MPDASELQAELDRIDRAIAELSEQRQGVVRALEAPDPTGAAPAAQETTDSTSSAQSTESPAQPEPPGSSSAQPDASGAAEETRKLS